MNLNMLKYTGHCLPSLLKVPLLTAPLLTALPLHTAPPTDCSPYSLPSTHCPIPTAPPYHCSLSSGPCSLSPLLTAPTTNCPPTHCCSLLTALYVRHPYSLLPYSLRTYSLPPYSLPPYSLPPSMNVLGSYEKPSGRRGPPQLACSPTCWRLIRVRIPWLEGGGDFSESQVMQPVQRIATGIGEL